MSSAYFGRSENEHNGRQLETGEAGAIRVALFSTDQELIRNLATAVDAGDQFILDVTSVDEARSESWLLAHRIGLAIVDLERPTSVGLRAIRLISNRNPATPVMALMSRRSLWTATIAVRFGAQSCLLKETTGSIDVIAALNGLVVGSNAISPSIARLLIDRFRQLH